MASRIPEE